MSTVLALTALLRRYVLVFRHAWSRRHETAAIRYAREDAEFLPAALALRDTPVHPLPRAVMLVFCALLAVAIVWACLGTVDVVAVAPGKVVPTGEVKTIQAQDTAVVEDIHVVDGQHVEAGQLLVDLDATDPTTDRSRAESELSSVTAELMRARAMLAAIDHPGKQVPFLKPGALDPVLEGKEQHILEGEYANYKNNLQRMNADVEEAAASLHAATGEIGKIEEMLPIEEKKLSDFTAMQAKGYVGRHDFYDEQQAVIQMRHDLSIQRGKRDAASAALTSARYKLDGYISDARRTWLEKTHDDEGKGASLEQDIAKAAQHRRLLQLRAPVEGTIQQLAAHTVGGVVSSAQAILTIVPSHRHLFVQAVVDNQDIGFVHEGQDVEIKVETFSFSRYGTLHGRLTRVSNDARQDEKLGLIFMADVALDADMMTIDGRSISLTPGMAVTAEIKTGRRSVASFILSPVVENITESFRER